MPYPFKQRGTVVVPLAESPVPMVEVESTDNPATFSETVAGEGNITGMTIYGKSTQVTTTGAQLFDKNAASPNTWINGQGVVEGANGYTLSDYISVTAGTYYGNFKGSVKTATYNSEKQFIRYIAWAGSTPLTINDGESYLLVTIQTNDDGNYLDTFMLNAGSTALPYEPYTGGKPSPSPEYPQPITNAGASGSIETIITGKNLLTGRLYYGRYNLGLAYIQNEDAVSLPYVPAFENSGICYAVSIRKGITYTFSVTNGNTNARLFLALYRTFEDAFNSANAISKVEDEPSASIAASEDGILVCLIAGFWTDGSTTIHECTESELLQLEIGLPATAYEAPHSQSIAVTTPNGLPGIPVDSGGNFVDATGQEWICNYRDWARGVDVKKVGNKTIDNTETWLQTATNDSSKYRYRLISLTDFEDFDIAKASSIKTNGFCDILPITSADDNYLRKRDSVSLTYASSSSSYFYIYMQAFENATIEEFEEYIHQHPLNFILPLKNPIETPIPADELAAYQALQTYDGTTVFNMDSGEPAASWEVKALVVDPNNTNPQVMRLWLDEETGHPVNINGRGARVGDTPTQQYILQPCSF